ncbi:hypothetical protein [Effusibacillus pohliae]|uniref:hypothetical protein n=1 Tax=Effusibacillus pohliae TaxID=232270 RepID=UPI00036644FE|nr:hypothetical protein [Effusibacillus pohliae]
MPQRLLKAGVFLYLLVVFIGSFIWIGLLKSGLFDSFQIARIPLSLLRNYQYYAFSGTIGGTLYCLRLFYWHNVHNKLNIHKWWIWYVLRPIMSGGTAIMMVILFQSGILLVNVADLVPAKIGLSFLIGYGFGKVMDKLDVLTETFFNGQTDAGTRPAEPAKSISGQPAANGNGSQNPDQPIQQIRQ